MEQPSSAIENAITGAPTLPAFRSFAVRPRHVKPVLGLCQDRNSSGEWNVFSGGGPLRDVAASNCLRDQLRLVSRFISMKLAPTAADRQEHDHTEAIQTELNTLGPHHARAIGLRGQTLHDGARPVALRNPSGGHSEATIQPWLIEHGIYSRGRFGAWRYEIGNTDHSVMQGVELAEFIVLGTPERTWALLPGEEARARIS